MGLQEGLIKKYVSWRRVDYNIRLHNLRHSVDYTVRKDKRPKRKGKPESEHITTFYKKEVEEITVFHKPPKKTPKTKK